MGLVVCDKPCLGVVVTFQFSFSNKNPSTLVDETLSEKIYED